MDGLVVNLANMITRIIGCSIMEAARIEPAELRSASLLGIGPEAIGKFGQDSKALVQELSHLF